MGWGAASLAGQHAVAGKLWHFDVNDGYRLKHDVDLPVGLVNPLDWLNVLMFFALTVLTDHSIMVKPPRTTDNWGVFKVGFRLPSIDSSHFGKWPEKHSPTRLFAKRPRP